MGARNRTAVRREHRDGRAVLVIDFRFTDKDGRERRYRRDASVQTAAGARAEAERLKRLAASRGTLEPEPEVPTFASFVGGDYERLVMPRMKPASRAAYRHLLHTPKHGLVALIGRKRLDTIGPTDVRAVEAHALGRRVQPHTAVFCMRSVLKAAAELGVLPTMPRLPKMAPRSRKLPAAPALPLVIVAMQAATGWARLAIALAAFAGLRRNEIRALQVQDVDLPAGRLLVRRNFSADELTTPKGRDERTVPLAPVLASLLAEAIEGKSPTTHVVIAGRGGPPAPTTVDREWRHLQARLGIAPTWHFHTLRHCFATACLRGGANVATVGALLGHKDLATTGRYLHATEGDLTSAIRALPSPGSGNSRETAQPSFVE